MDTKTIYCEQYESFELIEYLLNAPDTVLDMAFEHIEHLKSFEKLEPAELIETLADDLDFFLLDKLLAVPNPYGQITIDKDSLDTKPIAECLFEEFEFQFRR